MPARRARVLVVGHRKRAATQAMARFADDFDFVGLDAVSRQPGTEVTADLLRDVDAAMHADPFTAVVATSESAMLAAGFLRSQYGLPGLGYESSLAVTNKWRMRTLLRDAVPSPRAWLSGDFLTAPVTPAGDVVVKPIASSSARGVRRMTSGQARDWLAGQRTLWVVEEAVAVRREFHCDGAFTGGRLVWVETSEYDAPVLGSVGTRGTRVLRRDDPVRGTLARYAAAVVGALGVPDGVFHMEFLSDGERVYFGELGLRPAGMGIPDLLLLAAGAQVWPAFVAAQLGLPHDGFPPDRPVEEIAGLVTARPAADGRPPLPPDEAARLPGVARIGAGNLARGEPPGHACQYEYIAFYRGLTRAGVAELWNRVAGEERE